MTAEEAREWATSRFERDAIRRLDELVTVVVAENQRQNLIAPSTIDQIWSRHVVDSLQLLALAHPGRWLDIGTGAGFPGLAIAAADPSRDITLAEPRRLRSDHLRRCADALGLRKVTVLAANVEAVRVPATVISARAVAKLSALLSAAYHCSDRSTRWLLPKGRAVDVELAEARQSWHGMFHVEQSITNDASSIIVASQVRPR